jgi:CHASE3 domain sensor protein
VVNRNRRTAIATATFAILVVALLIAGGFYVRSVIDQSFTLSSRLSTARALAYTVLRDQLDEETGLRGFATTHQKIFLQPYLRARLVIGPTIAQLNAALIGLGIPTAQPYGADLAVVNDLYRTEIASRLSDSSLSAQRTLSTEYLGKLRVDRFRTDIRTINKIIENRLAVVDAEVRSAIDHIGLLVGAAIVLVLLLSFLYNVQQAALAARVESERIKAAEERREADILRSAYLTEKRIADTLQEAFAQRPLPTHPTFRFSATYVPASEEAKVGGDWYDALELPGNRVLFAIGDVTGHGIEAAVTMNRVRQTLISSALLDPMPAALLERVARELYADKAPLVTAVAGFADSNTY